MTESDTEARLAELRAGISEARNKARARLRGLQESIADKASSAVAELAMNWADRMTV